MEYDVDLELAAAEPYLTAQARTQALRGPRPRPQALPSMPSSGVEMAPPQPGTSPLTPTPVGAFQREMTPAEVGLYPPGGAPQPRAAPPDYRQKALEMMQQAANFGPTEEEKRSMVEFERKRQEGANRDFTAGLALSALGGQSFAPVGQQVLRQALAAREPLKVEGGYVTADQFVTDPGYAAKQRVARLETQAKIYETMAHNAETVEQRRAANEAAAEARRDSLELRRTIAANRPAAQEPLVQVFDPNTNSVIYTPRSQARGMQAPASARLGFAGPKMPNEIARMSIGISALEKTADEFEEALKSFGPRTMQQLSPPERARMNSISKRMDLESKEMFSLGALTGPDVGMLQGVLANPASWTGALYGKDGLNQQLASMRNAVKYRKQAIAEQYGSGGGGPGGIRNPAGVTNFPGGGLPPGVTVTKE